MTDILSLEIYDEDKLDSEIFWHFDNSRDYWVKMNGLGSFGKSLAGFAGYYTNSLIKFLDNIYYYCLEKKYGADKEDFEKGRKRASYRVEKPKGKKILKPILKKADKKQEPAGRMKNSGRDDSDEKILRGLEEEVNSQKLKMLGKYCESCIADILEEAKDITDDYNDYFGYEKRGIDYEIEKTRTALELLRHYDDLKK